MSDVGITSIWVSTSRQKRLARGDRSAHSDRRFFERHGVDVATIAHATTRDSSGVAASILGAIVDAHSLRPPSVGCRAWARFLPMRRERRR
jgi:hypothetical protein